MLEFLSMDVEGFASIVQPFHLELNNKSITVIRARNGSGKSTLLGALVWCLFGKNLKGISDVNSWESIRGKGYKGTKVSTSFRVDGKIHQVVRCSNYTEQIEGAKGGNRLLYYIEAEQVSNRSKNDIQALIEKSLGMGYSLFMNTVVFGQGITRLIQESGPDQKLLFEQMFDLGYISDAKSLTMEKMAIAKTEMDELERDEGNLKFKYEHIMENIHKLKEDGASKAKAIQSKITTLKERLSNSKEKLKQLRALEKELEPAFKELEKWEGKLETISKEREEAQEVQNKSIISLINELLALLADKKISQVIRTLKAYKEKLDGLSDLNQRYNRIKDKVRSERYKLENDKAKVGSIERVETDIEYLSGEIKDLQNTKVSVDNSELISKFELEQRALRGAMRAVNEKLKRVQHEYENLEWANKVPFGNQGIKTYLFSSSMDIINKNLAEYSSILGINIQFRVALHSAKKDFVPMITMGGADVDYKELSGGQKQLVNLAMAFAMNEALCEMRGVNIAFLDEVFESLSSDNIEIVTELIKKIYKDKILFLITHQESLPLSKFRVLKVNITNGQSTYQYI